MKTTILPLLALLLMVSCGAPTATTNITTIAIRDLDTPVDIAEEDIITLKDPKIIAMEYTPNSQLGACSIMGVKDDVMVTFDTSSDNIYLFNPESGKYISSFNRKGKSNKEYLSIFNVVTVDFPSRELYITDRMGDKIIVFDFEGEYQRHIKVDSIISFDRIGEDRYIGYNDNPGYPHSIKHSYNFNIYDGNFNLIRNIDPRTEADVPLGYSSAIYCSRNGDTSYLTIRDTIFTVTTEGLTPRYAIDKGRYRLPDDIKRRDEASHRYITFSMEILFGKYLIYLSNRMETRSSIWDLWDLEENRLIYRASSNDNNGIPVLYNGTTIYVYPEFIAEDGRIYFILMDESVEELGIDNDGNPIFISAMIE